MLPEWSADRVTPNAALSLGLRVNVLPQPASSWVRSRGPAHPWPHLVSLPKVTQLQTLLATLLFLKQASWQPCSSPKASTRVLSSAQNMLPFCPRYLRGSLPYLPQISAQISPTHQAFSTYPMSNSKCYCTPTNKVLPPRLSHFFSTALHSIRFNIYLFICFLFLSPEEYELFKEIHFLLFKAAASPFIREPAIQEGFKKYLSY